jgi:uncharacterized repeat protein (TIGR01451 family)
VPYDLALRDRAVPCTIRFWIKVNPGPENDLVRIAIDAGTVIAGVNAGYTITVRNRGRGSAGNVLVCDRVPRGMTLVGASRKLSRLGGRRCLVIPRLGPGQRVGLHVDFRVDGSAPTGTVANIADVTPGVEPPGSPEPPGAGDLPRSPAVLGARVAVRRAKAVVRVRQGGSCRALPDSEHRPPSPLWPRAPRRAE